MSILTQTPVNGKTLSSVFRMVINRLKHETDIALINSNTNGKDAIFHIIEVIKE